MTDKTRWAILGTGNIAKAFAEDLNSMDDAELVAVGSRAQHSADAFGDQFDIPRRYSSYEALASDADVDAVYVATPHSSHKENSILCLKAGKHVLCEKPFAINAQEAREMILVAEESGRFLMEAMWTRYFPLMCRLRELLAEGAIGEPRMLTADFGFRATIEPEGRLFNPKLGGGALLDVGVYPISLAHMIFGKPFVIGGQAHVGETGVDEMSAMVLKYGNGELAVLHSAVRVETAQEAVIFGTEGWIRIQSPWWRPCRMSLTVGEKEEVLDSAFTGRGYHYEAAEVMACVREGKRESTVMPLQETLAIMETMDELRRQWGLRYPME